jgi:hypothetical protein
MDRWEKTVSAPIRLDMFVEIPMMILLGIRYVADSPEPQAQGTNSCVRKPVQNERSLYLVFDSPDRAIHTHP